MSVFGSYFVCFVQLFLRSAVIYPSSCIVSTLKNNNKFSHLLNVYDLLFSTVTFPHLFVFSLIAYAPKLFPIIFLIFLDLL